MGNTKIRPITISTIPLDPKFEDTKNTPDQLLAALYWIWDVFDRANMPYFLVYKTAEDAIAQRELTGATVDIGVKKTEWISGGRRILDSYITPIQETDTKAVYEHEGVPVIIHVFEDSDCIVNTDMVRYRAEEFKIPNPYSKFQELYGTI